MKNKILFVCRHNQFRSRIAKFYFDKISKLKNFETISGGLIVGKTPLNPKEVEICKENSVDINGEPLPIKLKDVYDSSIIVIISDDISKKIFQNCNNHVKIIKWNISDKHNQDRKKISSIINKIKHKVEELHNSLIEDNPLVSVVVPLYNSENYIKETINSVLDQTYQNFEIIVCDDCSTDAGYKIVKEMAEMNDRIIPLINLKNSGKAQTVNNAFEKCSGKFICILDADDLFIKDKLQKQLDFLKKNPHIDLVYGNMVSFYENGQEIFVDAIKFNNLNTPFDRLKKRAKNVPPWVEKAYRILIPSIKNKRIIPASGVMFSRKIIDSGLRMDSSMRNIEDLDFWLNIIGHKFKIQKINHIAYRYRMHSGQKSENQEKMLLARDYILYKLKSGKYFR